VNEQQHSCPRCAIGLMQPTTATYTSVYRGSLLSVPSVPAWKCDVCQYTEYDDSTLVRLEALVGEFVFSPDELRLNAKLTSMDPDLDGDGTNVTRPKH